MANEFFSQHLRKMQSQSISKPNADCLSNDSEQQQHHSSLRKTTLYISLEPSLFFMHALLTKVETTTCSEIEIALNPRHFLATADCILFGFVHYRLLFLLVFLSRVFSDHRI